MYKKSILTARMLFLLFIYLVFSSICIKYIGTTQRTAHQQPIA